MINYWLIDPTTISRRPHTRTIRGGPLINLEAVQALLNDGAFDRDEQLWLATDKCVNDLQKEQWSTADVQQMLVNMDGAKDFKKSEWCQVKGRRDMVPCDVYKTYFDAERKCRSRNGLPIYIKFSIDVDGLLTIALVSCHAS